MCSEWFEFGLDHKNADFEKHQKQQLFNRIIQTLIVYNQKQIHCADSDGLIVSFNLACTLDFEQNKPNNLPIMLN